MRRLLTALRTAVALAAAVAVSRAPRATALSEQGSRNRFETIDPATNFTVCRTESSVTFGAQRFSSIAQCVGRCVGGTYHEIVSHRRPRSRGLRPRQPPDYSCERAGSCVRSASNACAWLGVDYSSHGEAALSCRGPEPGRCSWYSDPFCSDLLPGSAYPAAGGGISCDGGGGGWNGTWCQDAYDYLVKRSKPTECPDVTVDEQLEPPYFGNWACLKSCAHGGLFLKVRRAGTSATCLGMRYDQDAVNCSVYTDAGCTTVAACSVPSDTSPYSDAAGGIICDRTNPLSYPDWCPAAEDVVVRGAAEPTSCPPPPSDPTVPTPLFGKPTCIKSCTHGGLYLMVRRVGALAGCVGQVFDSTLRPPNCTLYADQNCTTVSPESIMLPGAFSCPKVIDWSRGDPIGDYPTDTIQCNRTNGGQWPAWCDAAEAVALRGEAPPTTCATLSMGLPPGSILDEPFYFLRQGSSYGSFACDNVGCYAGFGDDVLPFQRVCPLSNNGSCTWKSFNTYLRATNTSSCLYYNGAGHVMARACPTDGDDAGFIFQNKRGQDAFSSICTVNETACLQYPRDYPSRMRIVMVGVIGNGYNNFWASRDWPAPNKVKVNSTTLASSPIALSAIKIAYEDRTLEAFERYPVLSSRRPETSWAMLCPPEQHPVCRSVYVYSDGLCLSAPANASTDAAARREPGLEPCPWRRPNAYALWTRPDSGATATLRNDALGLCLVRSGLGRDGFGVNVTHLVMGACDEADAALKVAVGGKLDADVSAAYPAPASSASTSNAGGLAVAGAVVAGGVAAGIALLVMMA
ncbi:hypothetical protein DFJ74DRAFT_477681 [Hyaloraphidium curvatum]|nr:hypothetical protein DFJ74DRAFT_477681 [Hyaloraphidium curvatum]